MTLVSMFFKKSTTDDIRRYNIPKIGEVAVVFNGEDGEPSTNDIVIYPQNNPKSNAAFSLQNMNIINQNCDPMVYPILFFHGEPGWRPGMEHNTTKK